ncbi:uncharacterized protein LOC106778696 [Vigna radiata var. radiata]|uniref:Uncharacterized protein LOC106778696 n=1 Tax=Vigna radiata var. radiata TaxID=3916 RepID=A0A1S3VUV2_VIGRR|nr:uncharacterized protein LOC106778696 [Vigna radiata var. radiata]
MSLVMADGSPKRPYGVVEDVMVQINDLRFLVDFVVLEMEENAEIPIILGRSFMKTAKVIVNVDEGTIALKGQEEEVIFDTCNTGRQAQVKKTNPKASFKDASGNGTKAAKSKEKGKKCFMSQVHEEKKDSKGADVHPSPLKEQEGLRLGLPV